MNRRAFLKTAGMLSASALVIRHDNSVLLAQDKVSRVGGEKIKLSLNAYSFNSYLRDGKMDLDELFEYCAKLNFDAVDPTGYYFPGYPDVPPDDYIAHIRRKAFVLGLDISGTGVRQNFSDPDPAVRKEGVEHVKEWVEVASKLGAPVIRVFAGRDIPEGYSREEMNGWVAEALRQCVEAGKKHGVMIGVQNHDDYLLTSDHILQILRLVDSEWLGIILDVGSFTVNDPYQEIARIAPYAVSWQIKENLGYDDRTVKTDLSKIAQILHDVEYRGYIPIETLGGDPMEKVPGFLKEVREAVGVTA
ncbi:MAG: TIM barrel protein [Candidatus Marinimicrobia bacterium]|nr:TIM barrel protein [Candidatus Neomarinimicrobiota bacterium]